MIQDKVLNFYLTSLKKQIEDVMVDLSKSHISDMYQLGLIQGRIAGLRESVSILEGVLEDQDV